MSDHRSSIGLVSNGIEGRGTSLQYSWAAHTPLLSSSRAQVVTVTSPPGTPGLTGTAETELVQGLWGGILRIVV